MLDHITIPNDRLQAGVLEFVRRSALGDCTTVDYDPRAATVISSWPTAGFSSGELVAWAILRSLVSGELRRVAERLDADNVSALIDCLTTFRAALVSA